MTLKEAFRYSKFVEDCLSRASWTMDKNSMQTTFHHLYSKVDERADEDEVVERTVPVTTEEMITLTMSFAKEKGRISRAINDYKAKLMDNGIDLDSMMTLNRVTRRLILAYKAMLAKEERVIKQQGTGYRFNAEGNQTSFLYEMQEEHKYTFNEDALREKVRSLTEKCDETSKVIDQLLVEDNIEFEPLYDFNDSISEIYKRVVANRS